VVAAPLDAALGGGIFQVVVLRSKEEMGVVYAERCVTVMKNEEATRDGADKSPVRPAVSVLTAWA
jgi:hypothetical protein